MVKVNEKTYAVTNFLRDHIYEIWKLCIKRCYNVLVETSEAYGLYLESLDENERNRILNNYEFLYGNVRKQKNNETTTSDFYAEILGIKKDDGVLVNEDTESYSDKMKKIINTNNFLKMMALYTNTNTKGEIPLSYVLEDFGTHVLRFDKSKTDISEKFGSILNKEMKALNIELRQYTTKAQEKFEKDYKSYELDDIVIQMNNTGEYPFISNNHYLSFGREPFTKFYENDNYTNYKENFEFLIESIISGISDGTIADNISETLSGENGSHIRNITEKTGIKKTYTEWYDSNIGIQGNRDIPLNISDEPLFNPTETRKITLVTISMEYFFNNISNIMLNTMFNYDTTEDPNIEIKTITFDELFVELEKCKYYNKFAEKLLITSLLHSKSEKTDFLKFIKELSVDSYRVSRTNQMTMLENKVHSIYKRFKKLNSSYNTKPTHINNGILNVFGDDLLDAIMEELNGNYTHTTNTSIDFITNLVSYFKDNGKESSKHFVKHILVFLFVEIYKLKTSTSSFRIGLQRKKLSDTILELYNKTNGIEDISDREYYRSLLTDENVEWYFNTFMGCSDNKIVQNTFNKHNVNLKILTTLFGIFNIYYNTYYYFDFMKENGDKNDTNVSSSTLKHIEKFTNDAFVLFLYYIMDMYTDVLDNSYNIKTRNLMSDYDRYDPNREVNVIGTLKDSIQWLINQKVTTTTRTERELAIRENEKERDYRSFPKNIMVESRIPYKHYGFSNIILQKKEVSNIVEYINDTFNLQNVLKNHNFNVFPKSIDKHENGN